MLMGESGTGIKAVCPTGLAVLDRHVLGVGGIPYGRIVEIFGAESSGKTTIMDRILAGVQRDGGIAVLSETEHTFEPSWARVHGVDTDDLIFTQPSYLDGEDGALAHWENILLGAGGRHVVIALDSVAAMKTKAEFEGGIAGPAGMAEVARIWSRAFKSFAELLDKKQATLVCINQVRSKVGVMYGNPETTPGGNALKFYASVRLAVIHGKADGATGRFMKVKAVKNKLVPPYREAALKLDYATGFNEKWSILNHAKEMGCVPNGCKSLKEALANLHWDLPESDGEAVEGEEDAAADRDGVPGVPPEEP